jgi:cytochrome c oxidase cbb3-type subunit III
VHILKTLPCGTVLRLASVVTLLLCSSLLHAADKTTAEKAAAAKEGASVFRANCSPCHGLNARGGGRGPDLTSGRWIHGSTDAAIFRTISQGVPGTEMPANALEDSEIRAIIAYLRSLSPQSQPTVIGDAPKGKQIFQGKAGCGDCHMVFGHGGVLGPDLSRVGASRSVSYLMDSIREPDKELSSGMIDPNNHYGLPLMYDTVTVVKNDGSKLTGIAKNEDTYSVQLISTDQKLHLLLKKDLKQVTHERKSLMPPYSEDALDAAQLRDLVAYLETLRGEEVRTGKPRGTRSSVTKEAR